MVDSNAHNQVHAWIADSWLADKLKAPFSRQKVKLSCGGAYTFPAVSDDAKTIATVNTSQGSGKNATTKLNKVRSDLYFLLLAPANRRLALFTDRTMFRMMALEQREGRVPRDVELLFVELPEHLEASLMASSQSGG